MICPRAAVKGRAVMVSNEINVHHIAFLHRPIRHRHLFRFRPEIIIVNIAVHHTLWHLQLTHCGLDARIFAERHIFLRLNIFQIFLTAAGSQKQR